MKNGAPMTVDPQRLLFAGGFTKSNKAVKIADSVYD
jgi:hypothetical protein